MREMSLTDAQQTSRSDHFVAVVPAGRRPGADPLLQWSGVSTKALVPLAGKPMLQHVIDALSGSPHISRVALLTQEPEALLGPRGMPWLGRNERIAVDASTNSISESLANLMRNRRHALPWLITTADNALLTTALVDTFLSEARASGADLAVGFVDHATVTSRYPESQRTWLKFRDGWFKSTNLFAIFTPEVEPIIRFWQRVEQDRKKGWRVLSQFGPWLTVAAALRLLTLDQAIAGAGRRFGLDVRAIRLDVPEAAIDVDKPDDHALAERILIERRLHHG